jgi:hypothetical protein
LQDRRHRGLDRRAHLVTRRPWRSARLELGKDLVAVSDLRFEDRGEREFKGIPDAWRVFALVN